MICNSIYASSITTIPLNDLIIFLFQLDQNCLLLDCPVGININLVFSLAEPTIAFVFNLKTASKELQ